MFHSRREPRRTRPVRHRQPPALLPDGAPLERRTLLSITSVTLDISPNILTHVFPRDQPGHLAERSVVPVTIAGYVAESGTSTPTVHFQVIDSYGLDEPSGTIKVQPAITVQPLVPGSSQFFYTTRFGLSIRRFPKNPNREYTIVATAQDAQNALSATTTAPVSPTRSLPPNRLH
jgi:hypothetical protein